jgi:GNAT superfamily N-acetyltransferase
MLIRDATVEDALAISSLRVETWRSAYRGLIAGELLDALDAEKEAARRRARWDEMHVDPRGCEMVAEIDGDVVGWAACGSSHDRDLPRNGQVYAMYARQVQWSRGVGHALMLRAEDRLRRAGFRHAHLWVLDRNERAAAFYERHGWREDGALMQDERSVGGVTATLVERRRVRDLSEPTPRR